jgi:hypothetical protein
MAEKFIYDVKSSRLYSSDGHLIKRVFCPKAMHWNQLIADDPADRSRGCKACDGRVINLDDISAELPFVAAEDCVYIPANSTKVIFINNDRQITDASKPKRSKQGVPIIRTARSIKDINRAANMGYWPDVRLVEYRDTDSQEPVDIVFGDAVGIEGPLQSKVTVGQNTVTGHIALSGDFRAPFPTGKASPKEPPFVFPSSSNKQASDAGFFNEVIPFTYYYPHYQRRPIAAYLIPPSLEDGCEVLEQDPIEDLIGEAWNQGDNSRAVNVKGYIKDRKVILEYSSVQRRDVIG